MDAEIQGHVATDERIFSASDGSEVARAELYSLDSPAEAASLYPGFVNGACPSQVSNRTHPTIGKANQADEFECLANGAFIVAFQQRSIVFLVGSLALASVAEDLARAESAKI